MPFIVKNMNSYTGYTNNNIIRKIMKCAKYDWIINCILLTLKNMLYGVFLKRKYFLFNFNQNSLDDIVYIFLNTLNLALYSSSGIRAIDNHLQYIEKTVNYI